MAEIRVTRALPSVAAAQPVRKTYHVPIAHIGTEDVFVQRGLVPGTPVPLTPKFPHQSLDPILDIPCVDAVWQRCEKVVEDGANFSWPALGVHVYAAPSLGITDLTQVAQAVLQRDVLGVVLERIVYLVPRAALDANMLARAVQSRWVQCVQLADIHDSADASSPAHDTGLQLPPWTGEEWGDWPLAELQQTSRDFWLTPRTTLPFTLAPELADLAPWFTTHGALVHPTDGWKLLRWLRMVSAGLHNGRVSRGQCEAWIDHLVGHLAEILARKNLIEDFVSNADTHSQRVLCVEPQVQTPDGRYASDILVGDLDVTTRTLHLVRAHEVTSSASRADATAAQTRATLERRYPALGIRVLGDAQVQHFARLHIVLQADVHTEPIVIDDAGFRPLATHVVETVRAWHAITHAVIGDLPREAAVGVRRTTSDLSIAGKIAMAAMRALLADFAEQCQQVGRIELEWLQRRVAAVIAQAHSPLVRTQLQRMATVAENLIAHEGHVREPSASLATRLGGPSVRLRTWEEIFTPILHARGIPLAERVGGAAATATGHKLATKVAALCEAWTASDTPATALVAQVRDVDPNRAAVLENLVAREGHVRRTGRSLGITLGVSTKRVVALEETFTPILHARDIPLAERTKRATATATGHKLATKVAALCEAWTASDTPATALVAQVRDVDPNRAAVLENLVAREGHVRRSAQASSKTLQFDKHSILTWEQTFSLILTARKIPLAQRSERAGNSAAAKRLPQAVEEE